MLSRWWAAAVVLVVACGPGTVLGGPDVYQVTDTEPSDGRNYGPAYFAAVDGKLFVALNDGVHGREPWASDGTGPGTALVRDINPGSANGLAIFIGIYGDGEDPFQVGWQGRYFFPGTDGTHGHELWTSDGTEAGTYMLRDIHAGPASSHPRAFTGVGGTLFFRARDESGWGLWKTDGSTAGTVLLKPGLNPVFLTDVAGTLFFFSGGSVWTSDGTAAGTVLVKPMSWPWYGGWPDGFCRLGDRALFRGRDATHGTELWVSDGTAAGTARLKDIRAGPGGSFPGDLTEMNGEVYFYADDGVHGSELWKTDGTEAGTALVSDILPGPGGSYPYDFRDVRGTLFFKAETYEEGEELWKSDGTDAGTVLVKDIAPGPASSDVWDMVALRGLLVFGATDGEHGYELWTSDGTAAGTVVTDILPGAAGSNPYSLTVVGDSVFFAAFDGLGPYDVWRLTITPEDLIERLMQLLDDLDILPGIATSLMAKLEAALQALADGNEENDEAAISALEAFINALLAQSGKEIDPADAEDLIAAAQEILDMLDGG